MKKSLLRAALMVSSVALIPAATGAMAAVDSGTYKQIDRFMAAFEQVRSQYVERVDDEKLIKGAIDGMLASLDPHSSFLDVRDYDNLRTQTDGNYGGLGLQVTMEDGAVKVIAPTEDTPAWRAGVKSGDYITHLDGKLIVGGTLDEAVDTMRGKPGTPIKLTIVRAGREKPFDVTITREVITLKPVKWEVRGNVGVININAFSRATGEGVRTAIAEIDRKLGRKPVGYVVDLRSNPGGLLDQAVDVSDVFLESGPIVEQRGRDRRGVERYNARPGDYAQGLPVVVLVDSGTASAAEIVAGALAGSSSRAGDGRTHLRQGLGPVDHRSG
jgi:carboxyl-terminal processing protease